MSKRSEIKGAVIGMVLGDGCLHTSKTCVNSRIHISHSEKEKNYLLDKKKFLEQMVSCNFYEGYFNETKGKKYEMCSIRSRVHPLFSSIKEHMYYLGRRTVNEHILNCLSPRGLSYWFQDDGFRRVVGESSVFVLSSNSYNKVENELISRVLQKKFGLQWRVNKTGPYWCLRLRQKDNDNFINLIDPFISECMRYKVNAEKKVDRSDGGLTAGRYSPTPLETLGGGRNDHP